MELYGGVMTFAPEWLARPVANPALSGTWLHVFIYLFFFNFLWVLVPAILLYDSTIAIVRACDVAKTEKGAEAPPASGSRAYTVIAASLVAYVLLIPGVLVAAAMRK